MKKRKSLSILLIISFAIFFSQCSKKNGSGNPVDQLPPLTSVGKNTFGCLINGQVMIPKRPLGDIGPYLDCTYQFIYYSDRISGYAFGLSGKDKPDGCHFKSVLIALDSIKLEQKTYTLTRKMAKGQYGEMNDTGPCSSNTFLIYTTTDILKGQITIVFLDEINQIVSGTFWFDAINVPGDTTHIREGRFDMHYTR